MNNKGHNNRDLNCQHLACKYSKQCLSPLSLHFLARYNSLKLSRLTGRKKTQVLPLHFSSHQAGCYDEAVLVTATLFPDSSILQYWLLLATLTCLHCTWQNSSDNFVTQLPATPCSTNLFPQHLAHFLLQLSPTTICYTLLH